MALEIERKFLVKGTGCLRGIAGEAIVQGYASLSEGVLRIRLRGDRAYLTLKRYDGHGRCHEYEYPIPVDDARELLESVCVDGRIEKTRHLVLCAGHTWEVDVFAGDNRGLVMAELELTTSDEAFTPPPWLGEEVTGDLRYSNAELARNPFSRWRS